MDVGPSGMAGSGSPACFPEVDVRPAPVVLSAGTAHPIFLSILHPGLPIEKIRAGGECRFVKHFVQ